MKKAFIILLLCFAALSVKAQITKQIDSLKNILKMFSSLKHTYLSSAILLLQIRYAYLILFIFLNNYTFAQKNKPILDSLERLTTIQKDSSLAATYNELTWQYRTVNREKAFYYGQKAVELSTKINYLKGLAQAHNDLGILYMDIQDFNNTIISYDKALAIRRKLNDINGMAAVHLKIGIVYFRSSKNEQALDNGLKSLDLYKKINNQYGIASALHNIGSANLAMTNLKGALDYFKESAIIKEKINDKAGLSGTYLTMGNIYYYLNNNTESKKYFDKCEAIAAAIGDFETLSVLYNNVASWHEKNGNIKDALVYIQEAFDLRKKRLDTKGQVSSLEVWGGLLIKEKKFQLAEEKLKTGLQIAGNLESCLKEKSSIFRTLQVLYEQIGDYQKASDASKQVVQLSDSLNTISLSEKFAEAETKYQTQQKENKILLLSKTDSIKSLQITNQQLAINKNLFALSQQQLVLAEDSILLFTQNETILQNKLDSSLKEEKINTLTKEGLQKQLALQQQKAAIKQKNNTIIIIAIGAILLLVVAYAFYRKKQLEQQALLAQEQAKQREQITKAVIDAEEAERKRIASDLHDGVGQLFSAVKMNLAGLIDRIDLPKDEDKFLAEKTLALVDESCKEVRVISHKMMPNFLLKSGIASDIRSFIQKIDETALKIHFETKGFKEQLEFNEEVILYRVIQELINNVIKHSQANELYLHLEKTDKQIQVQVTDNGLGFNYDNAIAKGGLGLKNILVRIEYLKGKINFAPNKVSGTTVKINIPIA